MVKGNVAKQIILSLVLTLALITPVLLFSAQQAKANDVEQSFYAIYPVLLYVDTPGSWQTIDVSSSVPVGATGVIIHLVNTTETYRDCGFRKTGSTDDRTGYIDGLTHTWVPVGLDENRTFQVYLESVSQLNIYLVGGTDSDVVFFDNGYNKTPALTTGWQVADLSTECPNAVGIIVEFHSISLSPDWGVRKNGSTDDRQDNSGLHGWAIIGCDDNQNIEIYKNGTNLSVYVVGYTTDGTVFKTNATVKSLNTIDTWEDIDSSSEAPDAGMLFFEILGSGIGNYYGLRKNGTWEEIYKRVSKHSWSIIACDSATIVEGKIDNISYPFYLIGYATGDETWGLPGPPTNLLALPLSSDKVHLTWNKQEGDKTGVYAKAGSYPVNRSDGTQVYFGEEENCTHKDLSPGTTYYYRAWNYSTEYLGWSVEYDQDFATTLMGGEGPEGPPMPPEWFQTPACTAYEKLPFYFTIQNAATAYSFPLNNFCLGLTLLWITGASLATYLFTKTNMLALGVMVVSITICSIAGLLPMWMLMVAAILAGGMIFIWQRT